MSPHCRQGLFQTALKWPGKAGTLGWALLTYPCLSRCRVPQRRTRLKHYQLQPTVSASLCMTVRAARGSLMHVGLKVVPVWLMWMGCCCVRWQDTLLRLPGAWNKCEICCQNGGTCVDSLAVPLAGTVILPIYCKTLFPEGLSYS